MKSWYYTFKQGFTPVECAELIGYAQTKQAQTAVVSQEKLVTKSIRHSVVRWLDIADPCIAPMVDRINKMLLQANADCFGVDYFGSRDLQFTEYPPTDGKYDWHEDNFWLTGKDSPMWDRKLSLVVALSNQDSYEGGRLELDPQRVTIDEKSFGFQGDVIIFPSLLRHRVTPVTAGTRYSLVTWAVGPRWK